MIRGLGLDICLISRMKEMLDHPRFRERVFSDGEKQYLAGKGTAAAQTAAGLFAAKEAFLKAVGTGIDSVDLRQIEIDHERGGRPCYRIHGTQKEKLKDGERLYLSVTHDGDTAAAVCIIEGD